MYGKGPKDLCFVFFYMIFFTFLREFIMQVILRPLSIKMGSTRENKIRRMMEQMYSIFYYSISGPFGLYIMYPVSYTHLDVYKRQIYILSIKRLFLWNVKTKV